MRPTTRKYLVAAALTLLALPAAAVAARRAAAPAQGFLLQRMAQRLDLTPAQVEEIRTILKSHRNDLEREIEAVRGARQALRGAIHAAALDETAIRGAAARVAAAETELAVHRGDLVHEVRAVLTPEQQAEAERALADLEGLADQLFDLLRARFTTALG